MGASCFKADAVQEDEDPAKGGATSASNHVEDSPQNGTDKGSAGASKRGQDHLGDRFRRYTLEELLQATDRFAEQSIVSEGGRQAVNVVYRGKLKVPAKGGTVHQVAIKRFSKREWEDAKAFLAEAQRISLVDHPNITALVGFCSEGEDRLLLAEYMSHSTLAQHLFHWEQHPMQWAPRLDVAVKVAQALDYLNSGVGLAVYHDLNPYRVLFNDDMEPKLSCFGLMKPAKDGRFSSNLSSAPPELYTSGVVTAKTVVFMMGYLLLSLFSGKSMRPMQFVERASSQGDMIELVDSQLVGKPGVEQAAELVPVIVDCLQTNPEKRPTITRVAEFLSLLQGGSVVSAAESEQSEISGKANGSFKEAAMKGDWEQMHRLLSWHQLPSTPEPMVGLWNFPALENVIRSRQRGKLAFQKQDWGTAVEELSRYVESEAPESPVLLLRLNLAKMKLEQWDEALHDLEKVNEIYPGLLEAKCLQALAWKGQGKVEEAEVLLSALK